MTCRDITARDGVKGKYVSAFGGQSGAVTWQRLFLTREEAVALGVLLLAEFGWNLSVIDSPGDPPRGTRPGRRRPADLPRSRWSSPAAAPAATTSPATSPTTAPARPGRLITQALEATRFARAVVADLSPGTARLIVWRAENLGRGRRPDQDAHRWRAGPFRFGTPQRRAADWAKAEGLEGSPFRRGRRTVIALDRREPGPALPGHPRPSLRPAR